MKNMQTTAMPAMLYGTAWKKEMTSPLVEQALLQGFRGIDTACQPKHYHEAGVGEGIQAAVQQGIARSTLYLQTKFTSLNGQDPQSVPYDPQAPLATQVQQSIQVSLNNLHTDYLDCLLLHSPMPTVTETLQVWSVMEENVDKGDVLQLGISNCYNPSLLEYIWTSVRIKPAVVQNRFYAATQYDHLIRAFCTQHGLRYQSFWTLTANPDLLSHPLLARLSGAYQKSRAQVLFRYLTQIGVTPLTGTTSLRHMQEDLAVFSFSLSEQECAALTALLS
ncbi:MAG: aldo/keto reductase [Magnetococcales bacterium]|nr:aldo/keto reductase [Magnetococcales bacterium]